MMRVLSPLHYLDDQGDKYLLKKGVNYYQEKVTKACSKMGRETPLLQRVLTAREETGWCGYFSCKSSHGLKRGYLVREYLSLTDTDPLYL